MSPALIPAKVAASDAPGRPIAPRPRAPRCRCHEESPAPARPCATMARRLRYRCHRDPLRRQAARPHSTNRTETLAMNFPALQNDPETAAHRHAPAAARRAPAAALVARLRAGSPRRDRQQSIPRSRGSGARRRAATPPATATASRSTLKTGDGDGRWRRSATRRTSATAGSSRRRACAPQGAESDLSAARPDGRRRRLRQHLHGQLNVLPLSPRDLPLACAIVESLDDDGYLRTPLDELAAIAELDAAGVDADEMQIALKRVQSLDPCGVGARSVSRMPAAAAAAIDDRASASWRARSSASTSTALAAARRQRPGARCCSRRRRRSRRCASASAASTRGPAGASARRPPST